MKRIGLEKNSGKKGRRRKIGGIGKNKSNPLPPKATQSKN
jgi:hypothetical protein